MSRKEWIAMLSSRISCCFSGHRENKLPWGSREDDPRCIKLKNAIYDAVLSLYHAGLRHFICGMARGCDLYFCEAVQRLREELPGVTLEAVIPFEAQSAAWPEALRRRYDRLTAECDYQTVLQREYSPDCYMRRNRYMVDNASQIQRAWLKGHENIGITAGASAPEILVQEIVALLVSYGYKDVHEQEGMPETISFGLPKGLRDMGQPENQKSH